MGGKAVAQCVRPNPLGNASGMGGFGGDAVNLRIADRLELMLFKAPPAIGMRHALLAANLPPLAQKQQQVAREHRVAVAAALAAARAVSDRQDRLVLEAGRRAQHPRNLIAAQHGRQGTRMLYPVEFARQVRAIERSRVKEPQRRDRRVHRRRAKSGPALLDLVPA